jgi:hypothetical protein
MMQSRNGGQLTETCFKKKIQMGYTPYKQPAQTPASQKKKRTKEEEKGGYTTYKQPAQPPASQKKREVKKKKKGGIPRTSSQPKPLQAIRRKNARSGDPHSNL